MKLSDDVLHHRAVIYIIQKMFIYNVLFNVNV